MIGFDTLGENLNQSIVVIQQRLSQDWFRSPRPYPHMQAGYNKCTTTNILYYYMRRITD